MSGYLLHTTPLSAYVLGRPRAIDLIEPRRQRGEVATSLIVCGEVLERLKSFPDFERRRANLLSVLEDIYPYEPSFAIMERYADLRRALRPPYGPGLIGDIDTLIAATAIENGLTLITTDADFSRVPGLQLELLPRR